MLNKKNELSPTFNYYFNPSIISSYCILYISDNDFVENLVNATSNKIPSSMVFFHHFSDYHSADILVNNC